MNKCGTDCGIQNCYSASFLPRMHFNKFPSEPLPCSWPSAPGVGSKGILLAEMNSHRLTLFIPKTALSPGLPLFQSHSFPQTPSHSFFASCPSFSLPSRCPQPPPLPISAVLSIPILGTMKLFWLTVWPVE